MKRKAGVVNNGDTTDDEPKKARRYPTRNTVLSKNEEDAVMQPEKRNKTAGKPTSKEVLAQKKKIQLSNMKIQLSKMKAEGDHEREATCKPSQTKKLSEPQGSVNEKGDDKLESSSHSTTPHTTVSQDTTVINVDVQCIIYHTGEFPTEETLKKGLVEPGTEVIDILLVRRTIQASIHPGDTEACWSGNIVVCGPVDKKGLRLNLDKMLKGRISRMEVTDGGEGYPTAQRVSELQKAAQGKLSSEVRGSPNQFCEGK
jgi:hypothetical protein